MLFKTTIELSKFGPINKDTRYDTLEPVIRLAEEDYLVPIIGDELYEELNEAYGTTALESDLTAPQQKLLKRCRDVVAPIVCYNFAPLTEVKLSDAGVQRMENGQAKSAYQNQVANFKEQNLRNHEKAGERLLKFLEENKTDYPLWITSKAFRNYRSLFIKDGGEFDELYRSASPYRNYFAMRTHMADVEENTMKPLLGRTRYDELKIKDLLVTDTFTLEEKELLYMVKKAIAYLTVADSIPFLNIRLDANGITVMAAGIRAQNDDIAARSAALDKSLDALILAARGASQKWVNSITTWLKETAPLEPKLIVKHRSGNEDRRGSFGLI